MRNIIIVCLIMLSIPALACAEEYPVRWTKHIKINSIDEIDNILNNYVDEYAGTTHELTLINDDGDKHKVTTYKRYKELQDKGYYPETNWDILYQFRFTENCTSLELLKKAKPSNVSYIEDFDLTDNPLEALPPTLDLINTSDEIEKAEETIRQGKTWKAYDPTAIFEIKDEYAVHIEGDLNSINEGNDIYIDQQAWGDFNDDGIEDVLLLVTYYIKGASYRSCNYELLTRLEDDGPLIHVADW